VRLTPRTVEIFLQGERIAAHLRTGGNHRHTTVPEHMPSSHRLTAPSASVISASSASCSAVRTSARRNSSSPAFFRLLCRDGPGACFP
jgi:hypothetical protein